MAESRLHLEGGHKRKVPSRDKITQNTQTPPHRQPKITSREPMDLRGCGGYLEGLKPGLRLNAELIESTVS